MNRLRQTVSKQLIIALGFSITTGLFGQTESKTYQERFIVANDAVLDINISYADIEFETWDKEEVSITAVVTLDGATKEEAETYFKNEPFEMLGNTKKVSIKSRGGMNRFFSNNEFNFPVGADVEVFEFPEIRTFVSGFSEIAPFPEIPTLALANAASFDYEAYQKDGEKYMRKWQKKFEKSFNEKHQKELEEWALQAEKQASKMQKKMEQREEARLKAMEERARLMEHRLEGHSVHILESHEGHKDRFIVLDSVRNAPNIFFISKEGNNKNYKIKKKVKIKLPKSTRIKMDVRHGEVKLAENTKNLDAKLSYSSLWATIIDGAETNVSCSYTPVKVLQWNNGQLNTQFSNDVSLEEVTQMQLQATSSEVVIDKLLKGAYIKNNFGPLDIIEIENSFEELDITLKNAELNMKLPNVATSFYIKGNSSSLEKPTDLVLLQTTNGNTEISKGFHLKDVRNRSIMITSDYSEVVLH